MFLELETIEVLGTYARSIPPAEADQRENCFGLFDSDTEEIILMLSAVTHEQKQMWIEKINKLGRLREVDDC